MQQLIADSLTYWSATMGVDGFRFDEAAELGRDGASDFSGASPLLQSIAALANAGGFKIIAEPGDVTDSDWHEIGEFPAGWACWNGNYRDSVRLYMTGNLAGYVDGAGGLGYADAFYGDSAKMTAEGGPQKSVNYVVCHDGFNMTDLVSYGTPPASLAWPFGPEQEGGADNSSSWGGNPVAAPPGRKGLLDVPGPEPRRPDDALGRRVRPHGGWEQQLLQHRFRGHLEQL